MKNFRHLFKMGRPINALLALLGALPAAILSGVATPQAVIYSLPLFLLVFAGNIHNDICDIIADRINSPKKTLVQGLLTKKAAWVGAIISSVLALLISLAISPYHLYQSLIILLVLFFYNRYLKRTPIVGNLAVALLCAAAPLFPMGGEWTIPVLWASFFAGVFNLIREMIKDIQDVEGDSDAGMFSTAVMLGPKTTLRLARFLWMLAILTPLLPFMAEDFGLIYLLGIMVFYFPIIVTGFVISFAKIETERMRFLSLSLKLGGAGVIISLFLEAYINL
ncbi:UbiA family prenyltransferase [Fibrobacterales bacterium]|nr:UbiA family prenyltransferase [Fibrobacterales bacterium]